jgi:hypothetical protein
VTWDHLRLAVNRSIAKKKVSLGDLEAELELLWDQLQKEEHAQPQAVCVALPLFVKLAEGTTLPPHVKCLGEELQLHGSISSIDSALGRPGAPKNFNVDADVSGPVPPFIARLVCRCGIPTLGVHRAVEAFDLWRHTLNYVIDLHTFGVQAVPMARSYAPQAPWFAWATESGPIEAAQNHLAADLKPDAWWHEFDAPMLSVAAHFQQLFEVRPSKGSIQELLAEAIRLYGTALDQPHWHNAGLHLWQVLEAVTLSAGATVKGELLCRRVARLQRPDPQHNVAPLEDALIAIMLKRHRMVHRGHIGVISESDVSFLQRVCKEAIHWLFRNAQHLPTIQHLRWYFDYGGLHDAQAQVLTDILSRRGLIT